MSKSRELWLQNTTGHDVSISDLGVKVPVGKTINVYKYNPYITEDLVKKSLESGALSKKLSDGIVRIVKKQPANPNCTPIIKTIKNGASLPNRILPAQNSEIKVNISMTGLTAPPHINNARSKSMNPPWIFSMRSSAPERVRSSAEVSARNGSTSWMCS